MREMFHVFGAPVHMRFVFFPVNLSYVNLIIRPEPRREERKSFLPLRFHAFIIYPHMLPSWLFLFTLHHRNQAIRLYFTAQGRWSIKDPF